MRPMAGRRSRRCWLHATVWSKPGMKMGLHGASTSGGRARKVRTRKVNECGMSLIAWSQALADQLGNVRGLASGGLLDLLAATESIGQQDGLRRRRAHSRQQDAFRRGHRHVVFLGFETE